MNSVQIIGAIQLATGMSIPSVAKKHKISRQAIYNVANGVSRSDALRKKIQKEIVGDVVTIVWPEKTER